MSLEVIFMSLALLFIAYLAWVRLGKATAPIPVVKNENQPGRDEIITAAASNDGRLISRAIPVISTIVKNTPDLVEDEDFAEAACKLLYNGGQKLLCQKLMDKVSGKFLTRPWFVNYEVGFLIAEKQLDETKKCRVEELLSKFPDDNRLHMVLANYNDKRKIYKSGNLLSFERAFACEPRESRWLYAIARCHQNMANLSEALVTVNKLIELEPGFPGAHDLKKILEAQINPPKPRPVVVSDSKKQQLSFASDRYSQVFEMGRGGMGVVYKAYDEVLQRWVAIKTLQDNIAESQPELKQRFLGEARILAALDHQSIPKIFDLSLKSPYYIAFELINGSSLREVIDKKENPLELHRFLSFVVDISSAFAYAENKDVLHRDIKPENVLVTPEDKCYVIDFGLAQIEGQENLTQAGIVIGTPWYLAPERFRGEPATVASEIYSFGVMLFEMLEADKPYEGNDVQLVLVQEPKMISRTDIPMPMKILVRECLSKNPANRPESFLEICDFFKSELKNTTREGSV